MVAGMTTAAMDAADRDEPSSAQWPEVSSGAPGDLFGKCRAPGARWNELRRSGFYAFFREIESAQGPEVTAEGRTMIMLGSNNYLGLAEHPQTVAAAAAALQRYGVGTTGSRLLNGTASIHLQLERTLTAFHRRQAALSFSQGYLANLAVVSSLCGKGETVVLDKLCHASLLDACRLAQTEVRRFRHSDPRDLDRVLGELGPRPSLVAVEGVYSMEGDIAPLPEIVEVCRRRGARLLVDDAHGLGVLGAGGRGTAEHFGLEQEIDLIVGTFSKSAGTVGGYVVGDAEVVEFIRHTARPFLFTASMPPAVAAATMASFDLIAGEPDLRERLWSNTRRMAQGLRQLGYAIGATETPIIPVSAGSMERTMRVWRGLARENVFVSPVLPPAVPPGRCVLRVSVMATHTDEQIDRALAAFAKVAEAELPAP